MSWSYLLPGQYKLKEANFLFPPNKTNTFSNHQAVSINLSINSSINLQAKVRKAYL